MNKEALFDRLKKDFEKRISFLEDKPEETIDSSLKALWFAACGSPKSAEEVAKLPLPEISDIQLDKLNQLLSLRSNNVPLAHITGRQSFMGLTFLSDKRALIPRKETEILGKKACELAQLMSGNGRKLTIIDVCCGSGNLGISIACLVPNVSVYATDLSAEAVELTKENIAFLNQTHNVQAIEGDVLSAFLNDNFFEKTDLIVCNPPYISSAKVQKMNVEIASNEPTLAFDGGMFGTKIIQKLIQDAHKLLKDDGWLAFEVGLGQGEFVMQLCKKTALYKVVESMTDASGNIRVIYTQK